MPQPKDFYLDDQVYEQLRSKLVELLGSKDLPDANTSVVEALGEVGGIWPQSVLGDALVAHLRAQPIV